MNRRQFLRRATGLAIALGAAVRFGAVSGSPSAGEGKLFLIGLEEHFATPELQRLQGVKEERLFSGGGRRPELLDLGAGRIADIDEAGIEVKVLSAVTPGVQNLLGPEGGAYARKLNFWVAGEGQRISVSTAPTSMRYDPLSTRNGGCAGTRPA